MSENSNSNGDSSTGCLSSGCLWIIIFIVAVFCCNKCVYPELPGEELRYSGEISRFVFLDSPENVVDGRYICPALRCETGGFLSKHTQMLYYINGADSNAVISDAFTKVSKREYLYRGELMTDIPFVPIIDLFGIKGGETLKVILVEDRLTRIFNRWISIYNTFYVVPRLENQTFESWVQSCCQSVLNDVNVPFIHGVFISDDNVSTGTYIGDYTPSKYEPEEYIAKLNKDAYKERNNTPLQINDVEITYHCEGTAANVKVTFEPLGDTLNCSFIYHAINEYNWARTDNNTRFGYQSATILPGQIKYEFNITPEEICNNLDIYEKISDLALVGVKDGCHPKIINHSGHITVRTGSFIDKFLRTVGRVSASISAVARIVTADNNAPESKQEYYITDYDHRSSFWQKITLRPDLCAAWWKLLIAVAFAILSIIGYLYVDDNYSEGRKRTILTAISVVMFIPTIAYAVLWFVLAFF